MGRLSILKDDLRNLALKSKNQCAFPGCSKNLITKENVFIGQVCHIEAAEPKGQRYNSSMTDEQRRSPENLILLCYEHHKVTDDVNIYTVKKLKEMKNSHENSKLNDLDISRLEFVLKEFEKRLNINYDLEESSNKSTIMYYLYTSIETKLKEYKGKKDLVDLPITKINTRKIKTNKEIIKWNEDKFNASAKWVESLNEINKYFPKTDLLLGLDREHKKIVDSFITFIFDKYDIILEYYLDIESFDKNEKYEFIIKKYMQLAKQLIEDIEDFFNSMLENLKKLIDQVNYKEGGPEFIYLPTLSIRGFNFDEIIDYLNSL